MSFHSDKPFKEKVILLTGATSALGRELTGKLAKSGGTVYACDLEIVETDAARVHFIEVDVTDHEAFTKTVDMIYATHGHIDFLFNLTGLNIIGPATLLQPGDWKEVLDRNILGTLSGINLVYPGMVERRSGHIINISSVTSDAGHVTASPHACSKAFISGLHQSMQPEAARYNVSLSLVMPGYLQTDLFQPCRVLGDCPDEGKKAASLSEFTPGKVSEQIINGVLAKKNVIFCGGRFLWHLSHWFPYPLRALQKHFLKPFLKKSTAL
ncbi:SDR family oxidoreductase [Akkermansiaceae bacterium]|nr:SDR family oxidoreductase [Akkermansiaceae bacterium]MDB4537269.1 SDR family oxidoreductase [Akkermansiaceae bacterium]